MRQGLQPESNGSHANVNVCCNKFMLRCMQVEDTVKDLESRLAGGETTAYRPLEVGAIAFSKLLISVK